MAKYKACDIANWFLFNQDPELGDITNLKLQKLLYYAQAWYLVFFNNKPLFSDDFQAWTHGPAIPKVYRKYKDFGFTTILKPDKEVKLDEDTTALLNEIDRVYGKYSAKYLEELTHKETPWIQTRGNLSPEARCENIIAKDLMYEYYSKQLEEAKANGRL